VVELGVVLLVLMGWQFAAAEFIGGPIMILLLVLLGGVVFTRRLTDPARARLEPSSAPAQGHDHTSWNEKARSKAGWSDAASYTMADLTMLRRELVIGYVVAGVLAVVVPVTAWNDVFFHGHGAWTVLETALVGPVIAFISFVCSIGNVPLAAALWHGGISFGGVISFVFADLVTLPLFLIYRKFYGNALAVRLLLVFWAVMAAAGLIVEGLFAVTGSIPSRSNGDVAPSRLAWNYTSFLDVAALALFAGLYWLHRNRARFGGGQGYAIDPVCGMQVQTANAPASRHHAGMTYWFCSDRCADRFADEPTRHLATPPSGSMEHH
jgi:YHS domain-containing protein/uncharacterized membrane protein YraQ (UPF0718 family)